MTVCRYDISHGFYLGSCAQAWQRWEYATGCDSFWVAHAEHVGSGKQHASPRRLAVRALHFRRSRFAPPWIPKNLSRCLPERWRQSLPLLAHSLGERLVPLPSSSPWLLTRTWRASSTDTLIRIGHSMVRCIAVSRLRSPHHWLSEPTPLTGRPPKAPTRCPSKLHRPVHRLLPPRRWSAAFVLATRC